MSLAVQVGEDVVLIPIFATVVGGLVVRWFRRDTTRRRAPARFLSTVSHELRTPLNTMMGWVSMLKSGRLGASDTKRALESIERNLLLEAQLVDQLLAASRLLSGRVVLQQAPLDLRDAVCLARDRVKGAADARAVDVHIAAPRAVLVNGDEARLVELVAQLLANAIKFSPPNTSIEVEVTRVGDRACIRVSDQGDGIAEEDLPEVFEPFRQGHVRTRRTGLGLGLAITRQLVRLHGGTISAHSAGEGRGAIFRVSLPLLSSPSDSRETTKR